MTDAEALRAAVLECPNCETELREEEAADGLHLVCDRCCFFATEAWARNLREKLSG